MSAAAEIFRTALCADTLDALDRAETCHRGFAKVTPATLGIDADTYRRVAVCFSGAYEALCRARQLLDGAA